MWKPNIQIPALTPRQPLLIPTFDPYHHDKSCASSPRTMNPNFDDDCGGGFSPGDSLKSPVLADLPPKHTSTPKPKTQFDLPKKSCLINPRLKIERDNVIAASSSPSASSSQNRNSSHNALISSAGTSKASSVVSSDSSSASPSMSSSLGVAESGLVSGGGAGGGSQSTSSSQRQVKFSEANMAEHHVTIMDQPQITVSDEDHAFRTRIESSTYEGWDNPFRPEGELSHEAEELLRLWKEGKLKQAPPGVNLDQQTTLSPDQVDGKGGLTQQANGKQKEGNSSLKNGSKTVDVKREVMPQASSKVQHVTLASGNAGAGEDDAKKKKGCCSIM